MPELVFDGRNHRACSLKFPSIVDKVLSQHTSAVKKFHVSDFLYRETDKPEVDGLLDLVKERHVKDLRLEPRTSLQSMYILPQILFGSSKLVCELVHLQVSFCSLLSLGATDINWPRLKVLSMSNVRLSNPILVKILRGSPVLESLELGWCVGLNDITIHSTSVKHLLLSTNLFDLGEIRAPHLLSLHLSGNCPQSEGQEHISLQDISSLAKAKLDFQILPRVGGDNRMPYRLLKELLEQLCDVPTITIADQCLQILSPLEMEGEPPLLKCQNLILHGLVSQRNLPGIAYNLRRLQDLEKLVIHLAGHSPLEDQLGEESRGQFNFDEEDFLGLKRENFEYLAKHLKRVEIIGYKAKSFESNHLLALIKFLLGYAPVLEKLIIKAKLYVRPGQPRLQADVLSKLLSFSKKVHRFQRASNNAKVYLDYPPR